MNGTSQPSRGARPSRLAYLPVVLLVAVALLQLVASVGRGLLTPAKGGGFGMFATVDRLNNRHFVVEIVGPGYATPVSIPSTPARETAMREMLALPTEGRISRFAALVGEVIDEAKRSFDRDPRNAGRPGHRVASEGLRITVYKRAFDTDTAVLRAVPVRRCTVRPGAYGCR